MKKLLLVAPLAALLLSFGIQATVREAAAAEHDAVERAVLDYVEAIYDVKPELIERSVHPDLTKFGFWRESADQPYQSAAMTYEQLHALAAEYNRDGSRVPEDAPKEVQVLDVLDQTASAKLTASWGIDYMQLAKFDGKWKILHVLWQVHPSDGQ